jgi:Tfp pilus assembly protein PilW
MKLARWKKSKGLTLVEMLMSIGCGSFLLAAVITAGVSLQRSFSAVEGYSVSENDQLRVLDYIAMDCRRALSAQVSGGSLILTLPTYYNTGTSAPNLPTLTSGTLSYGSGSVMITYSQSGSNFNRQIVVKDSGGNTLSNTTTAIATDVATFTVTPQDLTASLSCTIMFFPTFRYTAGNGTWRSGPNPPISSLGVDGDLYVIDPTATDPSTVGNVYRRSGSVYSLLQNVKATTVYCNTFLRNAGARQ